MNYYPLRKGFNDFLQYYVPRDDFNGKVKTARTSRAANPLSSAPHDTVEAIQLQQLTFVFD